MSQLDNQIALVTGAGRGIGQAIALKLAGAGADIVAVDLQAEFCNETAQKVQALGRKTWCFAADVANAASVEALAGQVIDRVAGVDRAKPAFTQIRVPRLFDANWRRGTCRLVEH